MVAKHVKDKHKEEKEGHDNFVEIKDQPQFEDLNDKESHLRGFIISSHSDKKYPEGGISLNVKEVACVLCKKNHKSETNLKTHDKRYHMKKGSDTEYCFQY